MTFKFIRSHSTGTINRVGCERGKFTGENLASKFIKKQTLVQVFSCDFCKISQNTFSYRTHLVAASGYFITDEATVYIIDQEFCCNRRV